MKKCPFCAEEIQDEAVKCRHCGEFLDQSLSPKPKWYFKKSSLLVSFLVVGPIMLPLVWFHPQYSKTKKIILTVAAILFTIGLTFMMGKTVGGLYQQMKELNAV